MPHFGSAAVGGNDSFQFPIRAQSHVTRDTSLEILQSQLPHRWIFRPAPSEDYGLDGEIEIIDEKGIVKGNIFKFQIKGHLTPQLRQGYVIERIKVPTINYWLGVPLPVILFVVDTTRKITYWIDVKRYIRDFLYRRETSWRSQKTMRIKIPVENRLPDNYRQVEEIAVSHKERLEAYESSLEEEVGAEFIGYHVLIQLHDGDIDAWERQLRQEGTVRQLLDDLPFVVWLKEQLEKDKTLIVRIREMVQETSPLREFLRDPWEPSNSHAD